MVPFIYYLIKKKNLRRIKQNKMNNCNCNACNQASKLGATFKGAAVALVNRYAGIGHTLLLGLEKFGANAGTYNLCAGNIEPNDKKCLVNCAIRELSEEFKIKLSHKEFELHFTNISSNYRIIVHHGTCVFVGDFQSISSTKLTAIIKQDNLNVNLSSAHKEMSKVKFFELSCLVNIQYTNNKKPYICPTIKTQKKKQVSRFAKSVADLIVKNNF